MGRTIHKGTAETRQFYDIDTERNITKCKICNKKMRGLHTGNLKKHLYRKHPEIEMSSDKPISPSANQNFIKSKKIKTDVSSVSSK